MAKRFPIAYWGSIAYFETLLTESNFLLEINETYPKQTFRNRCIILTANGIQNLTIPITKPTGSKTLTKDILLDKTQNWDKIHWKAISSAYSSSPYFEHYSLDIQHILFSNSSYLIEINDLILQFIDKSLDLNLTYSYSNSFDSNFFINEFEIGNSFKKYQQVFTKKEDFIPNLSILDALFNLGPMSRTLFSTNKINL